jgi:hypothetical protein
MPRRKVLFIGNSFTARNDLPGLVARLAEAAGHCLDAQLISAGGASLRRHWNAGTAARAIEAGGFDRVVLQEQSTLPVKNAGRMHESVRLFAAAIDAAGARTVLYITWARLHAPESQQAITDAYSTIASEIGAAVIPAGVAWRRVLSQPDHPVLHDRDGSHPTLAGSYLAACCAFAVLFGDDPVGLPSPAPLTQAATAVLQRAAADAVRSGRQVPGRLRAPPPKDADES